MATTANFEITLLDPNQADKRSSINAAWALIDKRLSELFVHDMTADADYVLDTTDPANEHQNYLIRITDTGGNLTSARTVQFPANKGPYVFSNLTAVDLNARVGGAGGFVTIGAGLQAGIVSDGTDMLLQAGPGGGGGGGGGSAAAPYDFHMSFNDKPASNVEVLRIPYTRAVLFPLQPAATPHRGVAAVAATASTTFTFRRNGVAFATANFAAAATVATFTQAADENFVAGDFFTCDSPIADATLSGVGFALSGTRL